MQKKDGVVGYIFGEVGITEFKFAVDGHDIRKFDYIYAPHKEGEILAQVMDIKQSSDFKFEDAATLINNQEIPDIKKELAEKADKKDIQKILDGQDAMVNQLDIIRTEQHAFNAAFNRLEKRDEVLES